MNKTYIYDDNFYSLLSLIWYLINLNIIPNKIEARKDYVPNLLDEPEYIELGNITEKVNNLKRKLTPQIITTIYYTYLSGSKEKEMVIYDFIKQALIYQNKVFYYRNINSVLKVEKLAKMVSREAHRMKGFLRFKEMNNNFYYAEINPTNNVIFIVAKHFKRRMVNDLWIIKDVNRNIYALYDLNKISFLTEEDIIKLNLNLSTNENTIQDLWKTFFNTIAIKERKNLKLQQNFMPKKYWNNILEMENYNEKGI